MIVICNIHNTTTISIIILLPVYYDDNYNYTHCLQGNDWHIMELLTIINNYSFKYDCV